MSRLRVIMVGAVLGLLLWGSAAVGRAETVNRIVAIVNDDVITEADIHTSTNALLESHEDSALGAKPDSVEGQRLILRRLIEQRLILQEAKRADLSVSSDDVLERLQEMRQHAGSDDAFVHALEEMHLSQEQLKMRIREQLMIQRLIDTKVRVGILISPQEVAKELAAHPELDRPGDRVHARHLLIRVREGTTEAAARTRIEELLHELERGADFAELAKRYSEDSHASQGGDMGWVAQGELMPELDAALFALKPGACSQPIQSRLGFHLIKVEERRSAASLSVTEANRSIFQRLYQQKFQDAFGRWLTQLKHKAYIEIPEPS